MKVYEGVQNPQDPFPSEANTVGEFMVLVNDRPLSAKPSQKVWNHSPDGFSWGYAGSGPAQLSLALLLDALGDKERAIRLYQRFKFRVVASWQRNKGWRITQDEIIRICNELEQNQKSKAK